jgi:hypothetical protein
MGAYRLALLLNADKGILSIPNPLRGRIKLQTTEKDPL